MWGTEWNQFRCLLVLKFFENNFHILLMNPSIPTFIVDSFTNEVFKGNPAGVCLLAENIPDSLMQSIATELGLSETAFVLKTGDRYALTFYTPKQEIPLCGHATLASAKILFDQNPDMTTIHFITRSKVDLHIGKEEAQLVMEFPVYETQPAEAPKAMLAALGLDVIQDSVYNPENNILMLAIADSDLLAQLTPDFTILIQTHDSISGVLVTAPSKRSNFDFESRYFWPWIGTNEDPVTGATHTFMTKYWGTKLGLTKLRSFQSSERTGFMDLELTDAGKLLIKGSARTVLEGKIHPPD